MDEYLEKLRGLDSPTLSNAIERLAVRDQTTGYADVRVQCLHPELGTMVGHAVTATMDTSTPGPVPSLENLVELFEAVEASPRPSVMVFQEVGSTRALGCHCGEVMATIAKRLGCAGVVSDVGVRDADEVRALGMHYFAEGYVVSHGNFSLRDVGVSVDIAGMPVRSGDLLHGDVNGILTVPPELEGRLEEIVEEIRSAERKIMDTTAAENFTAADLRQFYG